MSPGRFRIQLVLAELFPLLIALPFAFGVYFGAVPGAPGTWRTSVIIALVLLVVSRFPNEYVKQTRILPPVLKYLTARRDGRTLSQGQLAELYVQIGAFVSRMQVLAATLWLATGTLFLIASSIWVQPGIMGMLTIAFATMVAASISLAFTYFSFKRLVQPILEEIGGNLATVLQGRVSRLSLRLKLGFSVIALTVLGFSVFGFLMYMTAREEFGRFALDANREAAKNLAAQINSPERYLETDALLAAYSNDTRTFLLTDAKGKALGGANADALTPSVAEAVLSAGRAGTPESDHLAESGPIAVTRVRDGQAFLVLVPSAERTHQGVRALLVDILIFLPSILIILGSFILWLASDTARILRIAAKYNRRLADGDLSEMPALWSDDEIGEMAESLRATFLGLGRMTREIQRASSIVDEEVGRVVSAAQSLSREVGNQTQLAERTSQSLNANEDTMAHISTSMETVALATQEVSSTVLQMQASVEEIAGNAEVLSQSVEKTVASSNEIAASAEEITGSTDQLHQNSQEAVSFLTELDAALEETRRNAKALSDAASTVTGDAETGFNTVAAVEEQILRMSKASEQNQQALSALSSSIERIGKIVDVIQDITEQTNLLSLNASIIAAGAGEYGKSFSVVATQIRELSARTSGNAKEIREMIRSIRDGGTQISTSMSHVYELVDKTFGLSRTAGESLRTILESASNQEEMSKRIAIATDELAHGGQSANRTMQRIFTMIEGITKASQEQARSTRYLNEEAERVREVALQLKNATDEQAKGARVISEAVNRITEDSQQTSVTVQSQAAEVRSVAGSMRRLEEAARGIQQAFQQLTQASGRLQQSASTLSHEIRAFKLGKE